MNWLYKLTLPNLFILFSLCSCLIILPVAWLIGNSFATDTSPSMRQAVSQISHKMMVTGLEMEIPYLWSKSYNQEDPPMPLSLYLFETLTNLNPADLTTVFATEIPGLQTFNQKIQQNKITEFNNHQFVIESSPPSTVANGTAQGDSASQNNANNTSPANPADDKKADQAEKLSEVFIYNTHNTESWSFAATNPSVTDEKTNISIVSKKLAEELEKRGVKTKVSDADHQKMLNEEGLPYVFSYAESLKTVKAALKQDKNIRYILDIHRDSMPRKVTTATIDGKNYAKIVFIIGKGNPHWEQNEKLAEKLDQLLQNKFPGISRGVDKKSTAEGNGEYNQSLSPNSVLIEIGGVDNTLEECNNTASALADIIADIYFEKDKKVDSPVPASPKQM